MAINPIVLEVLWNRLLSVANEQQVALMRTAFSTVVRESQDLACGVFDTRGYMIAQSLTGTPGHINPMASGAKHFLKAYPPKRSSRRCASAPMRSMVDRWTNATI
ncbi:MAG UNVERIFIED_CONTAM: hydantoinase B/oxoprolinase family protein [Anaerolineae bacterium]